MEFIYKHISKTQSENEPKSKFKTITEKWGYYLRERRESINPTYGRGIARNKHNVPNNI